MSARVTERKEERKKREKLATRKSSALQEKSTRIVRAFVGRDDKF